MTKTLSPAYAKRIASYERRYGKHKNRKAARGHKDTTYMCTEAINQIPIHSDYQNMTLSYWSANKKYLDELYERKMDEHLRRLVAEYLDQPISEWWFKNKIVGAEAPHKIDYEVYLNETWSFQVMKDNEVIYERVGNLQNV